MKKAIRVEIDSAIDGADPILTYVVIDDGAVMYVGPSDSGQELTSLAGDKTTHLRFMLEDAPNAAAAVKAIKKVQPNVKAREWKG